MLQLVARNDLVLITPHVGGATFEAMEATEVFMARKLARFLHGEAIVSPSQFTSTP
jgi:phosphoglycerate dehydrogenase-like enzyme